MSAFRDLLRRLVCAGLALACAACAAPDTMPDVEPGTRPALTTDEAGLWLQADRAEQQLRSSGRVETDPALNAYVRGIVCQIAGSQCDDIRLLIVRTPHFNATMSPNGMMQIWTGLILRAENEAQLAFVLGHEYAHYRRRHTLQRWRDAEAKANLGLVIGIATGMAGVGIIGDVANIALYGSVMAFTRENEREADAIGIERMAAAGYDPHEAARSWEALEEELRQNPDHEEPSLFLATHPSNAERIATLSAAADKLSTNETVRIGTAELRQATAPFRGRWLADELRRGEFEESLFLINRLLAAGQGMGELQFYLGELYRLRGENGDAKLALAAYESAISEGDMPAEVYRSLGLLHRREGDHATARAAFETYLALQPDAADRLMIEAYIHEAP